MISVIQLVEKKLGHLLHIISWTDACRHLHFHFFLFLDRRIFQIVWL